MKVYKVKGFCFYAVLLICAQAILVCSFNVADSGQTEKYFKRALGETYDKENLDFNGNSFFGYDLQVKAIASAVIEDTIRIATGAPTERVKTYKDSSTEEGGNREPNPVLRAALSSTDALGSLYLCETTRQHLTNISSEQITNCSTRAGVNRDLSGFEISDHDALGISLAGLTPQHGSNDDEQLLTCASLRIHDCGSTYKAEGACYFSEKVPSRGDSKMVTKWHKRVPCRDSCFEKPIDLMFVLDGSFSVTNASFEKVKKWVKDVTEGFDIADQVQVGVVQYSYFYPNRKEQKYITTEVELQNFKDQNVFDKEVDAIVYQGYSTYTAHAINKTVKEDFMGNNSRYPEARRVMILLTDGQADDSSELPKATAFAASKGVETFVVGVSNYERSELETIAGNKEHVITVEDFDDLATIVSQLQRGIQTLEGGGVPGSNNELMQCQVGLSATTDKTGRLVLGTVGAYDWAGTLTIYSSTTDQTPDIPDFEQVKSVLPNRTKESYLGYAVSTGYYNGDSGPLSGEYIAGGAPRYKLKGAVVVYLPESLDNNKNFTNSHTILAHKDYEQLGSYFGGVLLSLDVNNDNKDDLLVGAPLFIGESLYDEGRVFAYITGNSGNVAKWASESYKPQELVGKMQGGRFGSAIASAGDLNDDGYNDIAVGAPLSDANQGAVYIFHGGATGLNTKPTQIIRASELKATKLEYFGQSLQGGVDLDGNKYPDLAVGAPKSDTVVIFRTRPVVKITGTLSFSKDSIDVLKCFSKEYRQCVEITACLTYTGKSVEPNLQINYNVTLDQSRLEFRERDNSTSGQFDTSGTETLAKDVQRCINKKVYIKQNIQDYTSALQATFTFDLTQTHKEKPLSSVRDPAISNVVKATTEFSKSCGTDKVCLYDLKITASMELPKHVPSQALDYSQNGQRLIIAAETSTRPISVKVNMSNLGENAFDTRVTIKFSSPLSWINVENKVSSNTLYNNCIQDKGDEGNSTYKILRYVYDTKLGSIMKENSWCSFDLTFSPGNYKASGAVGSLEISVKADTVAYGDLNDTDRNNNYWDTTKDVRYLSDTDLTQILIPDTALFNFTTTNDTINKVKQIGNTSADMEYQYEFKGLGFSNIPESNVILNFPSRLNNEQHLLYPYSVDCSSQARTTCSCNQTLINPYNLTLPGTNVTGPNITMFAKLDPFTEPTNFNCGAHSTERFCQALKCKIYNLDQQSTVTFKIKFRLWTKAFNFKDFNVSTFTSHITLDSTPSRYILFTNDGIHGKDIVTLVEKYFPPEPAAKPQDLLWVYIVAAIAGLLLLLIIIGIMYKTGFFKSKYADMKQEQLEWNQANTNGMEEEMLQS